LRGHKEDFINKMNLVNLGNNFDQDLDKMLEKLKLIISSIEEELNIIKEKIKDNTIKNSNMLVKNYFKAIKDRQLKDNQTIVIIEENKLNYYNKINQRIIVHHEVHFDRCNVNPIMGDRYKCSICKDFDLCSKWEFKNFSTNEHPHSFIRLRILELSPERLKIANSIMKDRFIGNTEKINRDKGKIMKTAEI